ncbi:hypothetical protein Zm00014a_007683 [Zea mays]|uniref:Uncharacterized protein n=1 Tax=Zea mays TaxID=4577 RepID=A0A317YA14_MAIZE|nr:hypothetical protein Zm00014a_007683 [Zea mays]
MIFEHIMVF